MQKQTKFITALIFIFLITIIFTQKAESTDRISENRRNEQILNQRLSFLKTQNIALEYELKEAQNLEDVLLDSNYIGEFDISYYTAGIESTGKSPGDKGYGITRSGTKVEEGRTIAADTNILPMGSKVYIENVGIRTVEDTGSAINNKDIDVFVESVEMAMQKGRHDSKVYLIEWGES